VINSLLIWKLSYKTLRENFIEDGKIGSQKLVKIFYKN